MKGKAFIWIIILIIIIGGLYFFNRSNGDGDSMEKVELDQPVKIGGILPLTGDAVSYGTPIQRAAIMALDKINEDGGIGGQEAEIVWEDGQCDATEATTAAQKLINVEGVKLLIGGVCSSEALAIAPIAEENEVISISPSASSPDVTDAGEYTFRTYPSDALAGKIAAEYAFNELGYKTAAVVSENTDYAQGLSGVFADTFEDLGGEVVVNEAFETGVVDFSSQVLKISDAKPDVLYLVPQTDAPGVLLLKQLEQKEVTIPVISTDTMTGLDTVAKNADLLEGMIGVLAYFDEERTEVAQFLADYEERYGEKAPFPGFMASAYTDVYLIKEALEANGLDTKKIKDWLYDVKDWDSLLGKVTFDENGDIYSDYSILEAQSGELKQIEVYTPSN